MTGLKADTEDKIRYIQALFSLIQGELVLIVPSYIVYLIDKLNWERN